MRSFRDPFDTLLKLQDSLARAHNTDFFGLSTFNRGGFPGVNVFKNSEGYLLQTELPGVDKKEIGIEINGNILKLSGRRPQQGQQEGVSVHRSERKFGNFDRSIKLPQAIDADQVRAEYKDGVLKVHLPIAESEKPRTVQIN